VASAKWIDRQIDEVLLTVATTTGLMYARRRFRRALPKVMIGGTVVALGAAATATAAGIGVVGVAAGAAVWYRHRSKASAPTGGWTGPPTAVGSDSPPTAAGSDSQ